MSEKVTIVVPLPSKEDKTETNPKEYRQPKKKQPDRKKQNQGQPVKKKKTSRFRFYRINILLGILIAVILLAMGIYFCCNLKSVTVSGNTNVTKKEMKSAVLSAPYTNNTVYAVLLNFFKPVKNIAFVSGYQVKMTGLNSVQIVVTEKDILGYALTTRGKYVYFNKDGVVEEISEKKLSSVVPLTGINVDQARKGKNLPIDKEQLSSLLQLIRSLQKYKITVSAYSFDENGNITATCGTIQINFGSGNNMSEKAMRLPYILPKLAGMTGTLHLEDWSKNNTDIVFDKAA